MLTIFWWYTWNFFRVYLMTDVFNDMIDAGFILGPAAWKINMVPQLCWMAWCYQDLTNFSIGEISLKHIFLYYISFLRRYVAFNIEHVQLPVFSTLCTIIISCFVQNWPISGLDTVYKIDFLFWGNHMSYDFITYSYRHQQTGRSLKFCKRVYLTWS